MWCISAVAVTAFLAAFVLRCEAVETRDVEPVLGKKAKEKFAFLLDGEFETCRTPRSTYQLKLLGEPKDFVVDIYLSIAGNEFFDQYCHFEVKNGNCSAIKKRSDPDSDERVIKSTRCGAARRLKIICNKKKKPIKMCEIKVLDVMPTTLAPSTTTPDVTSTQPSTSTSPSPPMSSSKPSTSSPMSSSQPSTSSPMSSSQPSTSSPTPSSSLSPSSSTPDAASPTKSQHSVSSTTGFIASETSEAGVVMTSGRSDTSGDTTAGLTSQAVTTGEEVTTDMLTGRPDQTTQPLSSTSSTTVETPTDPPTDSTTTKSTPSVSSSLATTRKRAMSTTSVSSSPATTPQTIGVGGDRDDGDKVGSSEAHDKDKPSNMMPVVLGVLAVVALAVVIAVAVVLRRMSQQKKKKQYNPDATLFANQEDLGDQDVANGTTAVVEMEDVKGAPEAGDGALGNEYANLPSDTFSATVEPVPLDAFKSHVLKMQSIGGFDKEYAELPRGIQDTVTAAEAANEGVVKVNRFKDISPYDSCRVTLPREDSSMSDYINASYIDGFAKNMAYIAAQGPLPDTLEDFWHMVWVDSCGKVVMLTNLCEGEKVKCEQYWPEQEGSSSTFGRYTVALVKVTETEHFVHRVLSVTDQKAESGASREVHQFHFTVWPDHGVPCPVALVKFWSSVSLQPSPLTGPMVVHCSAGIGRTGTFIALDMLTQQAEACGQVSVFPTVRKLRSQRVNMVQTASQYTFLHEVVAEWLGERDPPPQKEEPVSEAPPPVTVTMTSEVQVSSEAKQSGENQVTSVSETPVDNGQV